MTAGPFRSPGRSTPWVGARQVVVVLALGMLVGQAVRGPDPVAVARSAGAGTSSARPSPATPLRLAVIGDSWSCGEGTDPVPGRSGPDAGFVGRAARHLGWRYAIACVGGTGYTTRRDPFSARADDVIASAPDVVLLQGSTNDAHASGRRIRRDAEALLGTLATALPDARLVVMGPAYAPAVDAATVDVERAALGAAARSADATWLDPAAAGVLDLGEDFADGVHPDQRGHDRLARWLAGELAR